MGGDVDAELEPMHYRGGEDITREEMDKHLDRSLLECLGQNLIRE